MHLTQPASIHNIWSDGGLSAHDDGTGAAVCHRGSLPAIPVCAALAGGLCLPAMWRQEPLADDAGGCGCVEDVAHRYR